MKLREHRGGLAESMETVIEIEPTIEALYTEINNKLGQYMKVSRDMIQVEHYGFDARINWDTYLVVLNGYGVYGYTDQPLQTSSNMDIQDGQDKTPS